MALPATASEHLRFDDELVLAYSPQDDQLHSSEGMCDTPKDLATDSASDAENAGSDFGVGIPY